MMTRASSQHAAGAGARPLVAIVGRPNVGKSTLFNRLAAERVAIVEDMPGVTRDRIYTSASALGRDYLLVDTGGFDPDSDDPLTQRIAVQVRIAIDEADLVVCVFDGTVEPLPADLEAARLLRGSNRPVIYVANKIDNPARSLLAKELYRLGIAELHEVAALHGLGVGELEEALVAHLPEAPRAAAEQEALPRIAIVGRPNAGKSSLVNRWLGEERQIVDARPGTTVDSVDSVIEHHGWRAVLVDTAGMRRRRAVAEGVEALSVMRALRAIEQCHTVLLMIDANAGPVEQDARIAGLAIERGRALVVALNKTDLLSADARKEAETATRDLLAFAPWAPLCRISAKTGRNTNELLRQVRTTTQRRGRRVGTADVNRFFAEVLERHPPPASGNQSVRLYYIAQVATHPPTFAISTNLPNRIPRSYTRYVSNQLRERFDFGGTPIRVRYRSHHARRGN